MATSLGRVYLNGCNYELAYDLLSQSTQNNTSTVRFYGILHVTNNYISWSSGSASVHTSGLQPIGTYYSRGDYTVVQADFVLPHDPLGYYNNVWIGASLSTTFVSGDTGGYLTLPRINRYPVLNWGQNFNDESNPTMNITSYNTFAIRFKIEAGGNTQLITRDVPASTNGNYTLVLTEAERNTLRALCPNSNTLAVRETVCAMDGNTELNASYKDYTMNIINANPTFSNFTFEDTRDKTVQLTGNNQYNVNGKSYVKATISTANKATANKGATMSKYRFAIGSSSTDINYSSSESVDGIIYGSSSGTYNVYAIDSRNNSTLVTKLSTKVIPYENIYINTAETNIVRNDNQVGTSAILTLKGTFWNDTFGAVTNTIKSVTYRLKKTDSSTWINGETTITPTVDGNNFTFTGEIASDNQDTSWDLDSSYNVEITMTDELSTKTINLTLNSAIPTMSLDKEGVGIMCQYDKELGGQLQVGGIPIGKDIYSSEEILTNKVYIDRNGNSFPVYRKVIYFTNTTIDKTVNLNYYDKTNLPIYYDARHYVRTSATICLYSNISCTMRVYNYPVSYGEGQSTQSITLADTLTLSDSAYLAVTVEYRKMTYLEYTNA